MGIKDFLSRRRFNSPVKSVQTSTNSGFSNSFASVAPMSAVKLNLYRELRNTVPVIDASIEKLVRLVCSFNVTCNDKTAEKEMQDFFKTVPVGGNTMGLNAFISSYFDSLLTYGTAVGEIIPTTSGSFGGLYNTNLNDIQFKRKENNFDVEIRLNDATASSPERPDLLLMSVLNPSAGEIMGCSMLEGLGFVSSILMKIYDSIGTNFERVGNVRYAVTYKPQNDALDKAYAKERAVQIASEWSKAMSSKNSVHDFVAVGDVQIKAIGADNQILDCEVPARLMLEEIFEKNGMHTINHRLLWSSNERK